MKLVYFLFPLILFSPILKAQETYFDLVEEDKVWYVLESGCFYSQTHIYKCEGDTIIDEENYNFVFISWANYPYNWMKYGYIREDTLHRVYYSPYLFDNPSYFDPKLFYDFNVNVNDTLIISSVWGLNTIHDYQIVIIGIDSVFINGSYRKKIWLDCDYNWFENYWIEGIGSSSGLLESGFNCEGITIARVLTCVKFYQQTIYPNNYSGSCYEVGIEENNYADQLYEVYPNPASHIINFNLKSYSPKQHNLKLYNSHGKLIKSIELNKYNSNHIRTDYLDSGLYLYTITSENKIIQKDKIVIQ